jgi:hypothetical protein
MQNNAQIKYFQNNDWKMEVVLGGKSGVLMPKVTERVDLTRIVQLNQTGVFLWNELENSKSTEELIQKMKTNFDVDAKFEEHLTQDVQSFLKEAQDIGAIQLEN